jgi:hypothetical protein
MPPHCDTMDGPVVKTAKMALETENVNLTPTSFLTTHAQVILRRRKRCCGVSARLVDYISPFSHPLIPSSLTVMPIGSGSQVFSLLFSSRYIIFGLM